MRALDRILRDGVGQQVEPHDGHREADHGNHDGSWGAEETQAGMPKKKQTKKRAKYLRRDSLDWLKSTPWL